MGLDSVLSLPLIEPHQSSPHPRGTGPQCVLVSLLLESQENLPDLVEDVSAHHG